MIKLADIEYVVFDTETTGLSPLEGDRIIEIAALKLRKGQIVDRLVSLLNPKRPLSPGAQEINGITQEMVQDAPTSREFLPAVIDFIGNACLVAHNASFDLKFLAYELALGGRKLRDETPAIDTMKMSKAFLPHLTSHRLEYLVRSLGIKVVATHRAQADAELTVSLFTRLLAMAPEYNVKGLPAMIGLFSVEKPSFRISQPAQPSLF
jgi:DNA polymerase-3 subunit alpha (Gram-positive type)